MTFLPPHLQYLPTSMNFAHLLMSKSHPTLLLPQNLPDAQPHHPPTTSNQASPPPTVESNPGLETSKKQLRHA